MQLTSKQTNMKKKKKKETEESDVEKSLKDHGTVSNLYGKLKND
jgi:hypothetical protein